jgi:LPS sulfotransferase NodH
LDQSRFCDVQYDDLVRDPVTCVTKIYDQFGLPMTEAFRQRLIRHVDKTHSSRSNAHVYSLDQFGLRQSAVE